MGVLLLVLELLTYTITRLAIQSSMFPLRIKGCSECSVNLAMSLLEEVALSRIKMLLGWWLFSSLRPTASLSLTGHSPESTCCIGGGIATSQVERRVG